MHRFPDPFLVCLGRDNLSMKMILPSFGRQRRWFNNGVERQPAGNTNVILVVSGDLTQSDLNQQTGKYRHSWLIPYDGVDQTADTDTNINLGVFWQDYNAFRYCQNNEFDIDPPFRGGQCKTAYQYSVTWHDPIDRQSKTAILERQGPLEAIRFNANGLLQMGGQTIASGGERRIIAPRVHSIIRLDGKADNCGDLPLPERYYCPENPKRLITLAPNESVNHYLGSDWLLKFNITADAPTRYRINLRV